MEGSPQSTPAVNAADMALVPVAAVPSPEQGQASGRGSDAGITALNRLQLEPGQQARTGHEESRAALEMRLTSLQQEAKTQLVDLRGVLDSQMVDLASSLRAQEEVSSQLGDLRRTLKAQAQEIETLRSQELNISVRAIKESVDVFDKLGARRAQEAQVALAELQDSAALQARELHGLDVQELRAALGRAEEQLDAQGRALAELSPKALQAEFAAVMEKVEAHSNRLRELQTQAREQHEERLRVLQSWQQEQQLRIAKDGAKDASASSTEVAALHACWQEERGRLQAELTRLRQEAVAEELKAPDPFRGLLPQNMTQATPLLAVAGISSVFVGLVLAFRTRQAAPAEPASPFGVGFCLPPRATGFHQTRTGRRTHGGLTAALVAALSTSHRCTIGRIRGRGLSRFQRSCNI